jgi:hypothetical protein
MPSCRCRLTACVLESRDLNYRPLCGEFISESGRSQYESAGGVAGCWEKAELILAKQLFTIFDEADEYYHGGAEEADKKHYFQQPHCKNRQEHNADCSVFWPRWSDFARYGPKNCSAGEDTSLEWTGRGNLKGDVFLHGEKPPRDRPAPLRPSCRML